MIALLKILHVLGIALFLGSIFGHILLTQQAAPGEGTFAWAQAAKHGSTLALTLPGLALTVASGVGLAALRRDLAGRRWLRLKVALTVLVALNGALVLSPVGAELAEAAASDAPVAVLAALGARESLFGAVNLLLVLVVIALAVSRPRLGEPS